MQYLPHPYQNKAQQHAIAFTHSALFLGMGLGKTVITLTTVDELLFDHLEHYKVLVIAPKKVAEETWTTEASKWDHLQHLKMAVVMGSREDRQKALQQKAHVYIINRENLVWLCAQYGSAWPFAMVVVDEGTSFKSPVSARFKALKKVLPMIQRLILLTGTPAPRSLYDLWAQLYLLDQGQRLGKSFGEYRDRYFKRDKYIGNNNYTYVPRKDDTMDAETEIHSKITDICISMKSSDYLDLPKRLDQDVWIDLPPAIYEKYKDFEHSQVIQFRDTEITAVNAGVLTNKLLQFTNGALYAEDGSFHEIHKEKLYALEEDIEAANGNPFLLFYQFRFDKMRLLKHLKQFGVVSYSNKELDRWNAKDIPVMIAHPGSVAYGLNLQYGGHLMGWLGVGFNLEWYLQGLARLDRQGQTEVVVNRRYVARNTVDQIVTGVLEAREDMQQRLLEALRALVDSHF